MNKIRRNLIQPFPIARDFYFLPRVKARKTVEREREKESARYNGSVRRQIEMKAQMKMRANDGSMKTHGRYR